MIRLGNRGRFGLGTSMFGSQIDEQLAHRLMDAAMDAGILMIDTAEMYPSPANQGPDATDKSGVCETIVGNWLRQTHKKPIIATKANGNPCDKIDGNLRRLGVDAIDLYMVHIPLRRSVAGYKTAVYRDTDSAEGLDLVVYQLEKLVRDGKIRHYGISNESPWGWQQYQKRGNPEFAQQAYNLLNRTIELGLAEQLARSDRSLIVHSPLAAGFLTGKYRFGRVPESSRLSHRGTIPRYQNARVAIAVERYAALAACHELDMSSMALAWLLSRPIVTTILLGATRIDQLLENIRSEELVLSEEVLSEIDKIHLDVMNPAP